MFMPRPQRKLSCSMGLPLPLALACALVLVSTTRLTNAVVEVPVCALVSSVHGGAEVGAVERAPEVTAAMQGLDDVNSRGCRLVSRDAGNCNRLVESAGEPSYPPLYSISPRRTVAVPAVPSF